MLRIVFAVLLACSVPALADPAESVEFGVLPVLSARSNIMLYDPLRLHIEKKLKKPVVLMTAPDYRTYVERTRRHEYRYLLTAPHFARLAQMEAGYTPLVRVRRDQLALIVVDRTKGITSLSSLKGKVIATPDRLAVVTLMGQDIIRKSGLVIGSDVQMREFPTFNSAVMALHSGEVAAALTSPPALHQMTVEQRDGLATLATSKPGLPICYLASPDVPAQEVLTVKRALLEFGATPEGAAFFEKSGYIGLDELREEDLRAMDPYVIEVKKAM